MMRYRVPEQKKIRVILDSDAKNEADDQYAIVQALLTKQFIVKGIIGAHFGEAGSMEKSYEECRKITKLMGMNDIKVCRGASKKVEDTENFEYSEGAELIYEEAMKNDSHPLFVAFLGPITDLACAYLKHPEIAGRLTAVWVGGGTYPDGCREFNLSNDILAANIIMKSGIELWQIPINVYSKMTVTLAELEERVSHCGEIGKYLFEQLDEFNMMKAEQPFWPRGEVWSLGDSTSIGYMMDGMEFMMHEVEAPSIDDEMHYHYDGNGRKIRVYHDINSRFILEDFFIKLKNFAERS